MELEQGRWMSEGIQYKALANILGGLCVILGFLVIIGWSNHSFLLVQINPRFAPMQFNTALCFFFGGISLILINNNLNTLCRITTSVIFLLSGATLLEYIFGLNLKIDELFVTAFVSTAEIFPGRMAPNASMGFMCIAIALFVLTSRYANRLVWLVLINIFITLSFGLLAIVGYYTDFTMHFGAGQWVRVSIHTAFGLIFLTGGLICYIYSQRRNNYIPLAPIFISFIIINTAFIGWQSIKKNQENYFNILLQLKINSISDIVNTYMQERVAAFSRITYRWVNRPNMPEDAWRDDIRHYIHDQFGYLAIELVDSTYKTRWIEPEIGNEAIKEINYSLLNPLQHVIQKSIEQKKTLLSPAIDITQGGQVILLLSPIVHQELFSGFMIGVINTQVMLEHIINKTDISDYGLKIFNGSKTLYVNINQTEQYYQNWNKRIDITLYGQTWRVVLWPSSALHNTMMSSFLPTTALIIGFIISILSGFLVQSQQLIKRSTAKLNKAQTELANTHERLQAMIEGSSGLVAAIDLDYNFIAFNSLYKSEIYRLFRVNLTVGMNINFMLNRMTGDNKKKIMSYWARALKGDSFTVQESFEDKHDQGLCYEIHYNPIRDAHNNLIGASHMATNIYQRLQNEVTLANSKKDLENLVSDLEKQNKELELLKELMSLLQSSITLQDAVETIGSYAKRILLGTSGIIYLSAEQDSSSIKKVLSWGEPVSNCVDFTSSECLALLRHQPYYIDDTTQNVLCTHLKHSEVKPISYACLPLFSQNETLGLLYVEMHSDRKDNQRLIALAQIISEQIALSLYNIKLRDSLRTQSIHDSLTGLYNRRFFEEYVNKELLKIKRVPASFALLLIDIDLFKRINDSHGHIVGDKVLCEIALKLQESCRQSDIIARWGGEEFIVFLRETSIEIAQARAELIRQSIQNLSIVVNDVPLPNITISIGLAFYPTNGEKIDDLILKADEALYQAKESGRNKVVTNTRKLLN